MGSIRTLFKNSVIPKMFNAMGEDAVYTPATGDPVSLKVLINPSTSFQPQGFDAMTWKTVTQIDAQIEDLGGEPSRGETFLIDETTYTIEKILSNDGITVRMAVK